MMALSFYFVIIRIRKSACRCLGCNPCVFFSLEQQSLGYWPVTEEMVTDALKEMDTDEEYNLFANNCQHWVKRFLEILKIEMPDAPVDSGQVFKGIKDATFVGTVAILAMYAFKAFFRV